MLYEGPQELPISTAAASVNGYLVRARQQQHLSPSCWPARVAVNKIRVRKRWL